MSYKRNSLKPDSGKIVILSNYWRNSPGGGLLTYTIQLYQQLIAKNYEVRVIAREGKDEGQIILPYFRQVFWIGAFLKLLPIKPRLIIAQNNWICLLPAILLKKTTKVSVLFIVHGIPKNKVTSWRRRLLIKLINSSDHIAFVSQFLRDRYSEWLQYDFSQADILYAGVPAAKNYSPEEIERFRNKYAILPGDILLLMHGATTHPLKAKGAKLLIDALMLLQKHCPPIKLMLTRSGKEYELLNQYCQDLRLSETVVFTGDLEDPILATQACNIYTHITFVEGGVSMAIMEAIAQHKLIVATPVEGIIELAARNMIDFPVRQQPEAIAEAIKMAMEETEPAETTRTLKILPGIFKWSATTEKIVSYLEMDSFPTEKN